MLNPKRKFLFQKSRQPTADTTQKAGETNQVAVDETLDASQPKTSSQYTGSDTNPGTFHVRGLNSGVHIIKAQDYPIASSGSISDISESLIDSQGPSSTDHGIDSLMIQDIRKSILVCGKVAGPTHVTDIANSVLIIKSRQVRMHQCKNTIIYLHCSSRPIIEDCTGLKFAPVAVEAVSFGSPCMCLVITTR